MSSYMRLENVSTFNKHKIMLLVTNMKLLKNKVISNDTAREKIYSGNSKTISVKQPQLKP